MEYEERAWRGAIWTVAPYIRVRARAVAVGTVLTLCAAPGAYGRTALEARKELANIGTEFKRSVFIESARESDAVAVELFLEAGMNPAVADPDGKTALVWAAVGNHVKILELLVAAQVDLDRSDNDPQRRTPLHWAAAENSADAVRFLIGAGANVRALDSQGDDALLYAVKRNHGDIARILLDAGANVDTPDGNGLRPIMWATLRGWTEGFDLLRAAGADLSARIRNATTATDAGTGGWYAVGDDSSLLTMAASRGHAEIVRRVLESGLADRTDAVSALTRAASGGHSDVVAILLAAAVPVNGRDSNNRTALFYAAQDGEPGIVRDLLAAGASEQMDLALEAATRAGYTPIVQMLMQARAYTDFSLDDWRNVVRASRDRGHTEIVEVLKASRSELTADDREPTARELRHFQGCLQAFGYDPGSMDGVLGDMTVQALQQFQRHNGLPETGSLDQGTREALLGKGCPRIAALAETGRLDLR